MTREERKTALHVIKKFSSVWEFDEEEEKAIDNIIDELEQEPRKGHWVGIDEEPHEDYECDKCGYTISTYTANIKPHTEYKYCPNCGAKMAESEGEE